MEHIDGCIHTYEDCLKLIALAINRSVPTVQKRKNVGNIDLKDGCIFIYNEKESMIKRWTDKKQWAPSRVYGCFLYYKEMNGNLCKKTFSKNTNNGKFHIVFYSMKNVEIERNCCKNGISSIELLFREKLEINPKLSEITLDGSEPKYRQNKTTNILSDHKTHFNFIQKIEKENLLNYCFPDLTEKNESSEFSKVFKFDKKSIRKEKSIFCRVSKEPIMFCPSQTQIFFERTIPLNDGLIKQNNTNECKKNQNDK
ncbi:hypothetical protein NUSPORA_00693 [Nucleospora cyclopteri]